MTPFFETIHAHMRILCGQNPSVGYADISIPAKPLTPSCSNVAGFLFPASEGSQ
jgi:hypothetical protein